MQSVQQQQVLSPPVGNTSTSTSTTTAVTPTGVQNPTGSTVIPPPGIAANNPPLTLSQAMPLPSIKIPLGIHDILKNFSRIDDSILQKEKRADLEQFILAFLSKIFPAINGTAYSWQSALNQTLNPKVDLTSQFQKLLSLYPGKHSFEEFAVPFKPSKSRICHVRQIISSNL